MAYLAGFIPTFERAYRKPYDENIVPFTINAVKYALSLVVIGSFSFETIIYPAVLSVFNLVFIVMVLCRRRVKKSSKKPLAKKHRARYSK